MKDIFFDDDSGVHRARYHVFSGEIDKASYNELTIFVVQKEGDGCSLINADIARTQLINKILKKELSGLQLRHIHFYYQWQISDPSEEYRHCWKFELDPELKDVPSWKEPESLLLRLWYWLRNKEIVTWRASSNILAGKVEVYSDFDKRSLATKEEAEALWQACQ